ncbi:AP2 domain-containing protein [Bacillus paranthracis]|uniref:AP2 domain-containing protein n=1 Tax=Bacillus paranthracis TaxID=2026186 RepID=UPI003D662392
MKKKMIGETFNKLTVLCDSGKRQQKVIVYTCICECGKQVDVRGSNLRNGHTKSCGCAKNKHGQAKKESRTPEYYSWASMISRCYNENHTSYPHYGGRGVNVCNEWRNDFLNFLKDMGQRPEGTTLDRIDPDGDYCKENCRWADLSTQARNKRPLGEIKHVGVTFDKGTGKYRARLTHKGKVYNAPSCSTLEEAIQARKELEEKYIK